MDFSETAVVCNIEVDRCSQLNYMTLMSTKGQGHSLTLVQISDSVFFNFFSSIITWPIEDISYEASLGWENESLFKCSRSHDQDGHHAHIW